MKYREINKLLSGGGVFYSAVANPFSSAAQQDMQSSGSSSSSKSSSDKILSDSIMNKLSETALPNDFRKFMAMLTDFEQEQAMGFGVDRRKLYDIRTYANQIIQQSNYLKQAEEEAVKNGAWDEFAIDSRGFLYVSDEHGKISKIAPSKFDSEKQTALTVGQLLQERKENDALVDRSDIATTVGNNIGIEKISDYILNIIKEMGSNENASEAYSDLASIVGQANAKRPDNAQFLAIQGIANELNKLGGDAIFKQKELMSSKNVLEAFNYILSVLPLNMKNQLIGRYVANGGSYEDASQHAAQLILNAVNAGNTTKYNYGIDYDVSMNKAAGNNNESLQKRNLNSIEVLVQGSLGKTDYKITNRINPSLSFKLHGNGVGALTNYDNNIIPKSPISLAIQNSISPLVDKNHISMGDQKIPEALLESIVYDGNDVINIWAPVDSNGDIDLLALSQLNELLDVFDKDPSLTLADKNTILQSQGINGKINEDGSFTGFGNMSQFLVFTGITSDEILNSDNLFIEKVIDKNAEMTQIDRVYEQFKKTGVEFKKGWFDWSTDLYKAPVFMKLKPNAQFQVQTLSNHGPVVNTPTYENMIIQDRLRYNKLNKTTPVYTPSSSILEME